jgi:hypothetical protein
MIQTYVLSPTQLLLPTIEFEWFLCTLETVSDAIEIMLDRKKSTNNHFRTDKNSSQDNYLLQLSLCWMVESQNMHVHQYNSCFLSMSLKMI